MDFPEAKKTPDTTIPMQDRNAYKFELNTLMDIGSEQGRVEELKALIAQLESLPGMKEAIEARDQELSDLRDIVASKRQSSLPPID